MTDKGASGSADARQSPRFLYLYALAVAGGSLAYIPFQTLLLPLQVTGFAKASSSAALPLDVLAYASFAGAVAASLANILFGWASDVTRRRRPWIAAGLILSSLLLIAMPLATQPIALIAMIILWQTCLNMMLAPLAAWAGDCVPDAQKGQLGGLMAFAPACGALAGALVTLPMLDLSAQQRLCAIAALALAMILPVLLVGRPLPMPHLRANGEPLPPALPVMRHAATRMWLARLLVQIAEASLFAFLLLWFRSLDPGFGENTTASLFTAVLGMAAVLTLGIGRWSDRAQRPIAPLAISALVITAGLLIMAVADGLMLAIGGYVLFGLASGVFLALHSSQTLRVLPRPAARGRDLGLFNLTNTVPSLIMPWLTLALVPLYGFGALFALLAVLALLACLLLSLGRG